MERRIREIHRIDRMPMARPFLWLSLLAWTAPGLAGQAGTPGTPHPKPAADAAVAAQTAAVNPDAALMQEFQKRVAEYVKIHKSASAKLEPLKSTVSQAKIRHHQHELREAILAQRTGAAEGDIFTPEIGAEFRRLIGVAYQGGDQHIHESLKRGEPVKLKFRVNQEYPDDKPLQSMPSSLLLSLPPLPPELEYRLVGRDLVLRDVGANLIVDFLRRAIPR